MSGSNDALYQKLKNVKIPYHILDYSDNRFTEEERKYLEKQLRSMFAFIGCAIPEKIVENDNTIPLREVLWRLLAKEALSIQEMSVVKQLISILDKKIDQNKKMIHEYNLTEEEAEKLYFEACGMLKALVTLHNLDQGSEKLDEAVKQEKIKDAQRLIELIKKIK